MRRSKFSLSHTKLFSCDTGRLIPCGLLEVLPGDTIQHNTSILLRCSPLLAPIMHRVDIRVHHWYVPHRLVWQDWEDFITGGPDGEDASVHPTTTVGSGANITGSIWDYYGVPTGITIEVSALPFRGYNLIWNEWYRDQDLETARPIDVTDGTQGASDFVLQRCAWEKDYFTSARPWEQKGPSISIPLGTTAPVVTSNQAIRVSSTDNSVVNSPLEYATTTPRILANPNLTTGVGVKFGNQTGLQTDLTGASAVTVNALREALALQRFEEARARYGSRYVEYLRYLGVRSSDARLQRPEYLGGGSAPVQFSEVLQTAEGDDPVGEMRGHGLGAMRSNRYRRFIEEHGYVHSFLSVRPKTIYANGLARTFNRRTKEDYWQKELEGIGQQEVLNKEIYAAGASPNDVFGFQDRYREYREQPSTVAGEFRTTVLDHWHFARMFSSAPALNASFVSCAPADDRVFAVPSQDVLYVMAKHSIQARRLVAQSGKSFIF